MPVLRADQGDDFGNINVIKNRPDTLDGRWTANRTQHDACLQYPTLVSLDRDVAFLPPVKCIAHSGNFAHHDNCRGFDLRLSNPLRDI
jgi:hypothetical protein